MLVHKYRMRGPGGEAMAVYYRRGPEAYVYLYGRDQWFDAMECCMTHGLDDRLSITVDEAGWICKIMEDRNGNTGHNSG